MSLLGIQFKKFFLATFIAFPQPWFYVLSSWLVLSGTFFAGVDARAAGGGGLAQRNASTNGPAMLQPMVPQMHAPLLA